jgi:serine/threonine-protein kinase
VKPTATAPVVNAAAPTIQKIDAKMVDIPAGEYTIGNNDGGEYERPPHKVTVKGFQIDVREVTKEEYSKFLTATKRKAPASWPGGAYKGSGDIPVAEVSWDDAVAYAQWAGKRLPTEIEWEIAASGKDHFLYPWGNQWIDGYANTKEAGQDGPQAAGKFAKGRSQFGVYDMCGNVWEWTESQPEPYPGSSSKIANADKLRVIRGGSYTDTQKIVTTTERNWVESTTTNAALGFRCAKDLP